MKRNYKSLLAFVLALMMLLSLLAGCNKEKPVETKPNETQGSTKPNQVETQPVESKYPDYLNLDGYRPIVKDGEKITLKIAVVTNPSTTEPMEDVWFVRFIEEVLNIDLEIQEIPYAERTEKINLLYNTGDLPDMMFVFGTNAASTVNYGVDQGLLLPISDYFDEDLTPNLLSLYEKNPLAMDSYTASDGKVYGMPQIRGDIFGAGSTIPGGYWIFTDTAYMKAAGYESQPQDVDGFMDMLRAFKNVGDQIGVDAVYPILGDGQYRTIFKNAMGWMAYLGDDDAAPYWDVEEGKVVVPLASDKYEEYVTLLKTLYEEELIHPDCFTMDRATIKALQTEQRAGVLSVDAPYLIAPERWNEYTATIPLKSEHNPNGLILAAGNFASSSYINISADTEYPELCVRLVDYLYSEEGLVYNAYGPAKGSEDTLGLVEGFTFDANDQLDYGTQDDNYENVSAYRVNNINLSYQFFADEYYFSEYAHKLAGAEFKGFAKNENDKTLHYKYSLAEACEGKLVAPLPTMYMSLEDNARYADLKKVLKDYCNQEVAKFMTGQRDMSEFAAFRNELEAIGLKEYLELVDKYYGNISPREIIN